MEDVVDSDLTSSLYLVRSNSHPNALAKFIGMELQRNQFFDVTLGCDGRNFRCHRIILSMNSPLFKQLILCADDGHTNPHLVMPTCIKADIMELVLDFIYTGETILTQDQLVAMLKVAETFEIEPLLHSFVQYSRIMKLAQNAEDLEHESYEEFQHEGQNFQITTYNNPMANISEPRRRGYVPDNMIIDVDVIEIEDSQDAFPAEKENVASEGIISMDKYNKELNVTSVDASTSTSMDKFGSVSTNIEYIRSLNNIRFPSVLFTRVPTQKKVFAIDTVHTNTGKSNVVAKLHNQPFASKSRTPKERTHKIPTRIKFIDCSGSKSHTTVKRISTQPQQTEVVTSKDVYPWPSTIINVPKIRTFGASKKPARTAPSHTEVSPTPYGSVFTDIGTKNIITPIEATNNIPAQIEFVSCNGLNNHTAVKRIRKEPQQTEVVASKDVYPWPSTIINVPVIRTFGAPKKPARTATSHTQVGPTAYGSVFTDIDTKKVVTPLKATHNIPAQIEFVSCNGVNNHTTAKRIRKEPQQTEVVTSKDFYPSTSTIINVPEIRTFGAPRNTARTAPSHTEVSPTPYGSVFTGIDTTQETPINATHSVPTQVEFLDSNGSTSHTTVNRIDTEPLQPEVVASNNFPSCTTAPTMIVPGRLSPTHIVPNIVPHSRFIILSNINAGPNAVRIEPKNIAHTIIYNTEFGGIGRTYGVVNNAVCLVAPLSILPLDNGIISKSIHIITDSKTDLLTIINGNNGIRTLATKFMQIGTPRLRDGATMISSPATAYIHPSDKLMDLYLINTLPNAVADDDAPSTSSQNSVVIPLVYVYIPISATNKNHSKICPNSLPKTNGPSWFNNMKPLAEIMRQINARITGKKPLPYLGTVTSYTTKPPRRRRKQKDDGQDYDSAYMPTIWRSPIFHVERQLSPIVAEAEQYLHNSNASTSSNYFTNFATPVTDYLRSRITSITINNWNLTDSQEQLKINDMALEPDVEMESDMEPTPVRSTENPLSAGYSAKTEFEISETNFVRLGPFKLLQTDYPQFYAMMMRCGGNHPSDTGEDCTKSLLSDQANLQVHLKEKEIETPEIETELKEPNDKPERKSAPKRPRKPAAGPSNPPETQTDADLLEPTTEKAKRKRGPAKKN